MYPSLRDHIAGMAGMAKPTPEKLESLYAGWDAYFAALNIVGEAEQAEEEARDRHWTLIISCDLRKVPAEGPSYVLF